MPEEFAQLCLYSCLNNPISHQTAAFCYPLPPFHAGPDEVAMQGPPSRRTVEVSPEASSANPFPFLKIWWENSAEDVILAEHGRVDEDVAGVGYHLRNTLEVQTELERADVLQNVHSDNDVKLLSQPLCQ